MINKSHFSMQHDKGSLIKNYILKTIGKYMKSNKLSIFKKKKKDLY